jgi:hypothetical protein
MSKKITDNIFFRMVINIIVNTSIGLLLLLSINEFKGLSVSELPFLGLVGVLSIFVTLLGELTKANPKANLLSTNLSSRSKVLSFAQEVSWKIMDVINGFFWLLFDSWRKPNVELFTRLSQPECIAYLYQACQQQVAEIKNEPITGIISGNHFTFYKWSPPPPFKIASTPKYVMTGILKNTPKGIYIRAWQRISNFLICLFVFIATVISGIIYSLFSGSMFVGENPQILTIFFWGIIAPPVMIGIAVLAIRIGSTVDIEAKQDLSLFLENTFNQKT